MKFLLLIICFLAANISFSQDSLRKSFSVGLFGSYGFGYRILKENNSSSDATMPLLIKARKERDFAASYLSFGVSFNYYFKNKLFLSFGENYNSFNYQTKETYYVSSAADPSIPEKFQTCYQTNTFELPLSIGYAKPLKKFELSGQVGIGTHLIYQALQSEKNWYYNGYTKTRTKDYSSQIFGFCLSLNSSIAFAYNPIKQISIRLSPELKYGITPINNTPLQTKILGYGVNLSVFYNLLK